MILGAAVAGVVFFFVLLPLAIVLLAAALIAFAALYARFRLRRLISGRRHSNGRINVRVRETLDE